MNERTQSEAVAIVESQVKSQHQALKESLKEPGPKTSYGQILKSSSMIGGAQAFNLAIGIVRTKVVAVLLGPSGVGLVGLYVSSIGLVGTLSNLGVSNSGVREIAEATGSGDPARIGCTVHVLRRLCWVTGLLGTLLTAILAWPLSKMTFNSPDYAWPIAILGVTLLLGSISGGQTALMQGVRRIRDLVWLQILSALAGTVVSIGLYAWLRQRGIVPVLIITAALNLGVSWCFARRILLPSVAISWRETFAEARGLLSLGLAFTVSGVALAGVALATRALIQRGFGSEANGFYQAAWNISGVFAGFILGAMGTDFYPRLTASAHDNAQVTRLVNEQTEVGVLLALPGLLGTLVFSPWIIHILYSAKFTAAASLLPWFVVGIFGRVVSWPLAYIQLAKGASSWFATTEVIFALISIGLVWVGLQFLDLKGVAVAFAIQYGLYILGMLWVAHRLCAFRWSQAVVKLLLATSSAIAGTFALTMFAPGWPAIIVGTIISAGAGFLSMRQICCRLGPEHRLSKLWLRFTSFGVNPAM
jgi:PST family polysaccharide transporter